MSTVSRVAAAILLGLAPSWAAWAQVGLQFAIRSVPPVPQPGSAFSLSIRATNPVSGFVLCPESSLQIIDAVTSGTAIVLRLSNVASAGGFIQPFCDSNSVSVGPLPAGTYFISASYLVSGSLVLPPLVSSTLNVGGTTNAVAVPVGGPAASFSLAALLLITGMYMVARERCAPRSDPRSCAHGPA